MSAAMETYLDGMNGAGWATVLVCLVVTACAVGKLAEVAADASLLRAHWRAMLRDLRGRDAGAIHTRSRALAELLEVEAPTEEDVRSLGRAENVVPMRSKRRA